MVVAVTVALLVVAGVGALNLYPEVRDRRDGTDLEPGLLLVDPSVRGDVALGDGVYVVLGPGGLTINRRSAIVWQSVDRGSPVTAGLGRLHWRGADERGGVLRAREDVRRVLGNMRVTARSHDANVVTFTGRVFDGGSTTLPLTLTITRRTTDSRVLLAADVPGADVVAIHEYRRPGYTFRGLGEQFARAGTRSGRWPIVARAQGVGRGEQPLTLSQDLAGPNARGGDAATTPAPMPFYLSSALSGVGLDSTAYAVVDLSNDGRVDLSVWAPTLRARLYDAATPRELVQQHTDDVGHLAAAPDWSTSGAVVGVRGGSARVRSAVKALRDSGAVLSAVLVRDAGDRRVYSDWDSLVTDLRAQGVRTLGTADPRAPVELHDLAFARGWLVPRTDLVDLTNPEAFAWYATVLGDRMRRDGLSGLLATGGFDLPMDARLANGDAATEHNAWPTRWARLTDAACRVAGVTDCLVLQDSAAERTPGWSKGVFNQAEQVGDWSAQDGLASVLPAKLTAGLSGMTQVASGVGGWSQPRVPLRGNAKRTDELLARWAELEAFGSLLRSEDGAAPDTVPQVWDSPARAAAFARSSRLFAATAAYRRQVMAQASVTGLPVVRPFWLQDTNARQAGADEEYFFGASLLVVPVVREGQREVRAVLPAGRWVELFSGRTYAGPPVAEPPRTSAGGGPVAQPADVPAPQPQGPDATTPPPPLAVTIPAPLGQPVVLYRDGDATGARLHETLRDQGLLG